MIRFIIVLAVFVVILFILPLAFALPSDVKAKGEALSNQSLTDALREARVHRGFILLTVGFFVCGF